MEGFLEFLHDTPTMFHAEKKIKDILLENNFIELNEGKKWNLLPNGIFYY